MATCKDKARKEYDDQVKMIDEDTAELDALITAFAETNKNKKHLKAFIEVGQNLGEDMRGWQPFGSGFSKIFQGLYTSLSNSPSMAVRGFTARVFENPQGKNLTDQNTVAIETAVFRNEMLGSQRAMYQEGFNDYMKEKGWNFMKTLDQGKHEQYSKDIYRQIVNPDPNAPASVKKGAQGMSEMFAKALEINKKSGVAGFGDVIQDATYVPKIINPSSLDNTITKAQSQLGKIEGENAVVEALALGYQRGKRPLDYDTALTIAKAQVKQSLDSSLTMKSAIRSIKNSDLDAIEKALIKAGLEPEDVAEYMERMENAEVKKHISNRAKFSLDADVTVSHKGVQLMDIYETDMEKLGESYVRETAGNSAFARKGFTTENQVWTMIGDLEKHMRKEGIPKSEVDAQIQMISDGVNLIYGRNIDTASSSSIQWGARMRGWTGFLALQNAGFASFTETARNITKRGIVETARNVPSAGEAFVSSAKKRGGSMSGDYLDPELNEVDQILRYVGEDWTIDFRGVTTDAHEEMGTGRYSKAFDRALATGQYAQSWTNAMRTIQGGGEKIVARSAISALKKQIFNGAENGFSKAEMQQMGWSQEWLDSFKKKVKTNHGTDTFEGKEFKTIRMDALDPEDRVKLRTGMYRLVKEKMQGQLVGETSPWMNKMLGRFVTQFRSFSIASLEKQLIRDIRHDSIDGAQTLLTGTAMASLMHYSYTYARSVGMDDKERDKYLALQYSAEGVSLGVLGRVGQLASVGLGVDFLQNMGVVPEVRGTRMGTSTGSLADMVPVIGKLDDVKEVGSTTWDILTGDAEADKSLKKVTKLIPFARSMGVNNAINATVEELK